jgi:hypothetical protein
LIIPTGVPAWRREFRMVLQYSTTSETFLAIDSPCL